MLNQCPPHEFWSRDKNLVLILLALGKNPLGVNARGGVLTFRFTREEVTGALDCWFGNRPIPLDDARRYIIASELFNSYVRGEEEFSRRDY
jgi:hypothetical protein